MQGGNTCALEVGDERREVADIAIGLHQSISHGGEQFDVRLCRLVR